MQFGDEATAIRQMKELLKDQAKFRAKLDRVVRKIETSSERTAKLAERNKSRKTNYNPGKKAQMAVPQQESEKVHGDKLHAFDNASEEQTDADAQGEPEAVISGQSA